MKYIDKLISTIAPHDCVACGTTGRLLCDNCVNLMPSTLSRCYRCSKLTANYQTCSSCRKSSPLDSVIVCTDYETIAKELVHQLKFERTYEAAKIIAQVIVQQYDSRSLEASVVTHLPTATTRVRQRGYDQAQLIAKFYSELINMPYKNMLYRHGQQRQTGNSRIQRLSQLEGAFQVRQRSKLVSSVLLVDDVMTTGASLEAAAKALKDSGVENVSCLVFARGV